MPGRGSPLTYSYFRGFVAPGDAQNIEQYVVAVTEAPHKYYMVPKSSVERSRLMRTIFARPPTWALDLCPEHPKSCPKGSACSKLHVSTEPQELKLYSDEPMLVCLKNGTNTHLKPSQMEPTAGLYFVSTLKHNRVVKELYPWVCQRHMKGTCPSGPRCLSLHVAPELVKDIHRPPNEASTTLAAALQGSIPTTPGLRDFIDTTLNRMGLRTIGDVAVLSNAVFEALMHRDIENAPQNQTFWLLLLQQRAIGRNMPLGQALLQFPGIDMKTIDVVSTQPWLATVHDLLMLRPKVLYSLPMRAQLLDACEKLRARFEDEREVYTQINLADMPPNAFFRRMSTLVCEFREKHAHKSWRKQDATRPIVTSLVSFVDPSQCKCSLDQATVASQASSVTKSPSHGPFTPGSSRAKVPEKVPSFDHWCQCPRKHVLAVNYELSTPSGSRCSEQNALGMIACEGLPTTCIREVFVHGGVHNSEDPNPLFPCGVCENMFRRVSKDVQKAHGGDVMLYMFDQEANPRKLVALPVSEISHREGSHFRKFVAEDLRDDGMSNGNATPALSMTFDAEAAQIPPAPVNQSPDESTSSLPSPLHTNAGTP